MTLALIDADILVYEAAYRCQKSVEWEPGEFTNQASLPEAQEDFANCVAFIMSETGASDKILALSDSDRKANFRRRVWPKYKANREGVSKQRPLLFKALRQWIRSNYKVKQKHGIEADDSLGILATVEHFGDLPPVNERIICSIDKDLLTIPGLHFNWRKSDDGVFEQTDDVAYGYFMCQTLIGDSTDGYPGCSTIGPVRALRILGDLEPKDMWTAVVQTFVGQGYDNQFALSQARCARILRAKDWCFETDQPLLWIPERDNWTTTE